LLIDATGSPENYSKNYELKWPLSPPPVAGEVAETVTSRLRRSVKLPQFRLLGQTYSKILLFSMDFLIISNSICNFVPVHVSRLLVCFI